MMSNPSATHDCPKLRAEIAAIRSSIRYHRGQVSDYRCWVDDLRLYRASGLESLALPVVPHPQEFRSRCEAFWDRRQREEEKGQGDRSVSSKGQVLKLPDFDDADLAAMSVDELRSELGRLCQAVTLHQQKGFLHRTVRDDEVLYALLPERVAWTSALPAREFFLANCERFCSDCQASPGKLLEWSQEAE